MPKGKNRRAEANGDWEPSENEDSYVNGSGGNSSSNRASNGGVGESGDCNDDGYINTHSGGGRPRQNKAGGTSQHRNKQSLGPWTEAVSETIQSMEAANKAIKNLQEKFTSHEDDLRTMEDTRDNFRRLNEDCEEKDKEIERQEIAITTLTSMNLRTQEKIEHEKKKVEKDRKELEQEKEKMEKRVNTSIAEEKLRLKGEVEKLAVEQGQSYERRRTELEDDIRIQRGENNKRVAALEAENTQLSTTVEQQKKIIGVQGKQLEKTTEQCDVLDRAKDSIKSEKLAREEELEMMKKEFALNPKPTDYFKQRFAEICKMIEDISSRYFSNIEAKDVEKVHKELAVADACFASVPIADTDDSCHLRVAHAQRIISAAICDYIWQPFRSDFTVSHPAFNDLLAKIADELEKSSPGGRKANVWTALTMQALQSIPADSTTSGALDPQNHHPATPSSRADGVVTKVFNVLSPLLSPSQREGLRADLFALAQPAIDIWNDAQTGELKIIVNPALESAHREEWRSHMFDPASPSHDHDHDHDHNNNNASNSNSEITSQTRPRIFKLFPRVMAREVVASLIKRDSTGLPGSWPGESHAWEPAPRTTTTRETCIHPGIGLPEWSALVQRGRQEQEETDEFLLRVMEDAKKHLHSTRQQTEQRRRESMGSLTTSVPSSPSEQWKKGGVMKSQDK